ncbi:zf-HC2 domain-containing protein [Nannocystis sp.]|uniref:anti-sigma factor family protein n=1 Tax=Nannocystis sp. TaxID=1962667 RepID=UPI0024206772|nr:zf-HC2 domain-containing protein [Nannocystis sp.]MBK7823910.1 zf-HC2 domain-containing protein [Nannocystis sp.]MBK9754921.1 zf-HC2 domain-containing protein [Nannocystis sp.]
MTTRLAKTVNEEQLSAYFDGELDPGERAEVEQWLKRDAAGRATIVELGVMREAIVVSLEAAAAKVQGARFEQIWDEIDRALDRETAAHPPATAVPSFWSRVFGVLRPAWAPVAAVTGVAVVAIVFVSDGAVTPTNSPEVVVSKPTTSAPIRAQPEPAEPEVEAVFPEPDMYEAEIERIEFGGKNGRIGTIEGKRGTTTVIWVSDEDATPGQRSL